MIIKIMMNSLSNTNIVWLDSDVNIGINAQLIMGMINIIIQNVSCFQ